MINYNNDTYLSLSKQVRYCNNVLTFNHRKTQQLYINLFHPLFINMSENIIDAYDHTKS